MKYIIIVFAFFSLFLSVFAQEEKLQEMFTKGIEAHLREPEYTDGVLQTEKGGVVTSPGIRIQASNICYQKKIVEGQPLHRIEAEGALLLEYGEYIFVGTRLEYDFESQT